MLVGQTAINLAANIFSAAFGLINVMIFTRLFAPAEFGTYVLGLGFGTIASTFMTTWLRLPIMREQARGDGTDIRGIVVPGLLVSCLSAPVSYLGAVLIGLDSGPALAAAGLAVAISFFDTGQELLRARLRAFTVMKATIVRAVMVSVLGVAVAMVSQSGVFLLVSSALAYLVAAWAFTREVWGGAAVRYDGPRLFAMAKAGIPLTASLTLLALSSLIDRFIIAHLIGPAAAGQYSAGVDLVRQALIIPAVSAAEFLLAIMLPACIGFAVVSSHIANVILGPDFRSMAVQVMPIVSVAIIFQIMSYQYLHISFLLSERNTFYLLNTGSALAVNLVVSYLLIQRFGAGGAAWGRLAAEVFGFGSALLLTRWAFPMPMPYLRLTRVLIATIVMAIVVRSLELALHLGDKDALAVLLPVGVVTYLIMCWLLDIAKSRRRFNRGLLIVRNALAR
jgi:O-antigen/teichoic acid export membrane protein